MTQGMFDPRVESAAEFEARQAVDQAVDEAAQILVDGNAPLSRAAELLAALQGPAVRAVLEKRAEQIVSHGKSLQQDLEYPPCWLANNARARLQDAVDAINAAPAKRDLVLARRRTVAALAVGLAAVDVLDALIAQQRGE